MMPINKQGKGRVQSAFLFGFSRSQVIYLIAAVALAATSTCSAAMAKKTTDWDKALEKGNHLLQIGDNKEAVAFFSEKLAKDRECAPCHLGLGRALKKVGRISEAKAEFQLACQSDPNLADAFYELGVLQESDKEWARSAENFQKYLDLKPDAAGRKTIEDRILYDKNQM
ncbi:MAG TPA: tetratricopeptide repeat protein [Trichormus sp.]|jgi:tetratricopeptide (TPR) repeat protein